MAPGSGRKVNADLVRAYPEKKERVTTNKYTLKDPYKWNIHQSSNQLSDINLAVVYAVNGNTIVDSFRTIRSPKAFNAKREIVKAMDDIKCANPELFQDYTDIIDAFNEALTEVEHLNDIQLSEILNRIP